MSWATIPVIYTEGTNENDVRTLKYSKKDGDLTSHREDLIQTGNHHGEEHAQDPHSECVNRHERVIDARYGGADFGIRRFAEDIIRCFEEQ